MQLFFKDSQKRTAQLLFSQLFSLFYANQKLYHLFLLRLIEVGQKPKSPIFVRENKTKQ